MDTYLNMLQSQKPLLNQRVVERLSASITVSKKQRDAVGLWLTLMKEGDLDKETENYPKFQKLILDDILGYPFLEVKHEKYGIEFSFENEQGEPIVCFDAKGLRTDNLFDRPKGKKESPVEQLWRDMGKAGFRYGVATNYNKFILLDALKGFNTFYSFSFKEIKYSPDKLKEFIAVFSKERLVDKGFIEKIKEESENAERDFSNQFYNLFHETRLMLIKEFQDNGAPQDQAIHYAQIFLNRLMFVFFAEDTGKLQKRLLEKSILDALSAKMQIHEHSKVICDTVIGLFRRLDTGSETPVKIYGFNGGLFEEKIPSNIFFKDLQRSSYFDDVYQQSTLKKSKQKDLIEAEILSRIDKGVSPIISNILLMDSYDFTTEVNVDILGHIFEQSITDIEKLQAGETSRRKKEGIYYTPEYVTNYICRNTIIPYLSKNSATTVKELIEEHSGNIPELEKKFREIKILDPACGSGAFLIKAVDVLLEIHSAIQEHKQKKGAYTIQTRDKKGRNGASYLSWGKYYEQDEAREIIENSIYGVDINEESVEITKLSLFLKIARENKKLLDLSKNIKCGNSLIDDKTIDPRAFKWDEKFPQIIQYDKEGKLKEGYGVNIVIGNPPYVRQEKISDLKPYLKENYESFDGNADLYVYFFEGSINLSKERGIVGLISSNKWMRSNYGEYLRNFVIKNRIVEIIDFGELPVFEDAATFPSISIIQKHPYNKEHKIKVSKIFSLNFSSLDSEKLKNSNKILQNEWVGGGWILENNRVLKLRDKLFSIKPTLGEYVNNQFLVGIKTACNEVYILSPEKVREIIGDSSAEKTLYKPFIMGTEVRRYRLDFELKYLLFPYEFKGGLLEPINLNNFPKTKQYLLGHKEKLSKRAIIKEGITKGTHKWYELQQINKNIDFNSPKIIYPDIGITNRFVLDREGYYVDMTCFVIPKDDPYLLAILNSKLYYLIFSLICPVLGDTKKRGRIRFKSTYIAKAPIKQISSIEQKPYAEKVELLLSLNKKFQNKSTTFQERLHTKLNFPKTSNKLDSFWELSFADFKREVRRVAKLKLQTSLEEKRFDEYWSGDFEETKKELIELKQKIDDTEKEIDQMVYDLYQLTPDEIEIVEKAVG